MQTRDLGPFHSPLLYLLALLELMGHLLHVKSVELRRLSEAEETLQALSVTTRPGFSYSSFLKLLGFLWPEQFLCQG